MSYFILAASSLSINPTLVLEENVQRQGQLGVRANTKLFEIKTISL